MIGALVKPMSISFAARSPFGGSLVGKETRERPDFIVKSINESDSKVAMDVYDRI